MTEFPQYLVLDVTKVLHELHSFFLADDRGYEEMVRQVFDYFGDATADNGLFHTDRVPHLNHGMVRGLSPSSVDALGEAQLAFATLYDGIRQELLRLGVDKFVAQGAEFPYMLDHIRRDRQVVLRRLRTQDRITSI